MHSPIYTFREGIEPVAYQIWPTEQSEVIHEACARTPNDREFPLYADDIEAMRCLEPIHCDVCEGVIAAPKQEMRRPDRDDWRPARDQKEAIQRMLRTNA